MAYGDTSTDAYQRPHIVGQLSQTGGGPARLKDFLCDSGAAISGVDAGNMAALKAAGATITPKGGGGTGAGGGHMAGYSELTFMVPVVNQATPGIIENRFCSLPFVALDAK